ncbi:MAG TPA: molybdopterin cofactor-binding domain-containing protein, partial [Candidatus Limnocylindrales bacterium]|nr:molybdopterin cofactor-binding domain-containing protein [Candidatus Limnocylindrales bacterium]
PPMPDAAPSPAPPALAETISGRRRYVSDLRLPGMLHGRVLRPPVPGATLRSVDLRAALAQPSLIVAAEQDFVGVAAADPATAERALAAVEATWDVPDLPSEADLEAYLRTHPIEQEGWGGTLDESSGDVEAALAGSTVRHEATYTTAYVAHVPAETRCALAEWRDGRLSVWVGTQVPFGVRAGLAQAFGLAIEDVRVVAGPTGSAFGGKADAGVAVEAARLAQAAGRPVRVKWSREEEFRAGYLRPAAVIDVRAGLGAQGDLAAWSMTTFNAGPNALAGPYAAGAFALRFQPTARPLPQGAYRALAATANTFARESHLDELARRAGQDPLAFRLRHLADERLAAVLRAAADQVGWGRPDARPQGMGLGLACGLEKGGRVATVAQVRAAPGERLELVRLVTAIECGAIVEPAALRSQVEGGTVMALGPALGEVIHFTAGRITNARLADYAVPRFVALPRIEVVLLDRPDLPSAGAGEVPLISVAPAIANAIRDACGLRLTALPLVPDGVVAPGT